MSHAMNKEAQRAEALLKPLDVGLHGRPRDPSRVCPPLRPRERVAGDVVGEARVVVAGQDPRPDHARPAVGTANAVRGGVFGLVRQGLEGVVLPWRRPW